MRLYLKGKSLQKVLIIIMVDFGVEKDASILLSFRASLCRLSTKWYL